MPDLTFDQVREAGRHAQHVIDDLRHWDWDPYADALTLWLPLDEEREPFAPYALPARGWHHVKGCDCEFCRS